MIFTKIARITHRNHEFNELEAKNIENVGFDTKYVLKKRFAGADIGMGLWAPLKEGASVIIFQIFQ